MINMQDVYSAFIGSVPLNFKLLSELCQVKEIEFLPKIGSSLHIPQDRIAVAPTGPTTCRILLDHAIAPTVVVTHGWDTAVLDLYKRVILPTMSAFTLIDIGANSGLVTRQLIIAFSQIRHSFAYEPHPSNFECLVHNLRAFTDVVEARNCALGASTTSLELFTDRSNCGNYSLNKVAVPAEQLAQTLSVPVNKARDEAADWRRPDLPIFYKSDTQGYDEIIATDIDLEVWDSVFIGTMELWRIEKPAWSVDKFRSILDKYPNKVFKSHPDILLSTDQVLSFACATDGSVADIVFWK
jgi:FkbM family methyltransferase